MKSPQTYPYIVIRDDKGLRKIAISLQLPEKNSDTLVFGPYSSKTLAEKALQAIKEHYKINCNNPGNKSSGCLNYSLGLCIGICLGGKAIAEYETILEKIILLLKGKDESILKDMRKAMLDASSDNHFEKAAKYRESLKAIESVVGREKVIEFTEATKNIAILEALDDNTVKFFLIKGNKVLFKQKYERRESNPAEIINELRSTIYTILNEAAKQAKTTIHQDEIDEAQIIYSYLKNSACRYFIIPKTWLSGKQNVKLEAALNKLLTGVT